MPITKQYLKSKPQVKVTFEIAKEDAQGAQRIVLLSDHNNWAPIELKKFKNGKFKHSEAISLADRNDFQFIYKVTAEDGNEFTLLPDDADKYIDNGITDGGKNAVVVIKQS
jgi:hypothetical protein